MRIATSSTPANKGSMMPLSCKVISFVTAALLFPDHAKYIASREFNRESLGRRVRELFPLNFCRSTAQHPKECAKSKRKCANYFQRVQRSSDMDFNPAY
jgi:hypothetical protein